MSKNSTALNLTITSPELDTAIDERKSWHFQKASGNFTGRDRNVAGWYVAQASYVPCPECKGYDEARVMDESGGYPVYAIYSYKTLMYEHCHLCGHTTIDARYYSETTRRLQIILARHIPAYKEALDKQYEVEKEARELWRKDQRRGLAQSDRILRYNGLGQPIYARGANLFEMLEHYHKQHLPGHYIHNAD